MADRFATVIQLAWPFLLAAMLAVLAVGIDSDNPIHVLVPFGPTPVVIDTSGVLSGRIVLSVASVLSLLIPAFRDYSKMYPSYLRMDVFFDDAGVQEALNKFSKRELANFAIDENWRARKSELLGIWNSEIRRHDLPVHVMIGQKAGSGHVTQQVTCLGGWQKYQVAKSEGHLSFQFSKQGQTSELETRFELQPSPGNRIEATVADIYFKWTKIIHPRFTQFVIMGPLERFSLGDVVALTKIRFFPVVEIGRTVYLFLVESAPEEWALAPGPAVPVAYSVYEW